MCKISTLLFLFFAFVLPNQAQLGDFLQNIKDNFNESVPQFETLNHQTLNKNELKGDYTYHSPCIVFENSNLVNRVSGLIASGKVENELIKLLAHIGITKGRLKLSFKDDNSFVATLNGKKANGRYEIQKENLFLQNPTQLASLSVNAKCEDKKLLIAIKIHQLLPLLLLLGQNHKTQSTEELLTYFSKYSGLRLGMRFER